MYLEVVTKRENLRRADACRKSGFAPMTVRETGYNYSHSGHEYSGIVYTYDCQGCRYYGQGCAGCEYDRINAR